MHFFRFQLRPPESLSFLILCLLFRLVVQRCLQLGYQVTAVQHSEKNPFRVQDVPLVPTTTNTRHPRPTSAAREAPAGPAGQEQVHVASFSEPPTPPLPISPTLSPGSIARRMLSSMLSSSASSPSSSASLADEITNDDTVLYTWRASRLRELPSGPLSPSLRHEAELGALAGRLAAQAGEVSAPFVESEGSSPASVLSPAERILAPETPRLTERKEAVSSLPSAPPTSAASGGPASTYTHLRVVTGDLWDVNELQRLLRETHHDAVLFCARSELGGGRYRKRRNAMPLIALLISLTQEARLSLQHRACADSDAGQRCGQAGANARNRVCACASSLILSLLRSSFRVVGRISECLGLPAC